MKDGYVRAAAATTDIRVADCEYNGRQIIEYIKQAAAKDAALIVFPELSLTGYTCQDLFHQRVLTDGAWNMLMHIIHETKSLDIISLIGLPFINPEDGKLYNVSAVIGHGRLLALVPKRNMPNYSEFYEVRHFKPFKSKACRLTVPDIDEPVPFGSFIFRCRVMSEFAFGIELCEDLWVPMPPSNQMATDGAIIICNLSASDEVIGKAHYRKEMISSQSARLLSAYVYADAGFGESTQDMIFSGHNMIYENGVCLAESKRFSTGITYADIDVSRLSNERKRMNTFEADEIKTESIYFDIKPKKLNLIRKYNPTPFVPSDKQKLTERCEEILTMQATGLATRIGHIGCKNVVIGLSGGLDSSLALIVAVHAFDMLQLDRSGIIAVTMPCFGTTERTKNNALALAKGYGVTLKNIPVGDAVNIHFRDIGQDTNEHDVTYENSQARERTQVLMDIANKTGGIVIGTGDLSELALGWATYNGDHMSMYAVNASIPKTLVRYLVGYEAEMNDKDFLAKVLQDVLDTPVSPELLPPEDGEISQKTEDLVGPYLLHDFYLYYFLRMGFAPSKIYRIAKETFKDEFDEATILKWLKTFIRRFFSQQFKRSCLPDGPKVGTVTLSPRSDLRMPSDAEVTLWLSELKEDL